MELYRFARKNVIFNRTYLDITQQNHIFADNNLYYYTPKTNGKAPQNSRTNTGNPSWSTPKTNRKMSKNDDNEEQDNGHFAQRMAHQSCGNPMGGVKTVDILHVRQPLCTSIPTLRRNNPTAFLPQPAPLRSQLHALRIVNRTLISLYLIIYSTAAALRCGQRHITVSSLCETGK